MTARPLHFRLCRPKSTQYPVYSHKTPRSKSYTSGERVAPSDDLRGWRALAGPLTLFLAALAALVGANSGYGPMFRAFWSTAHGVVGITFTVQDVVDKGLMTVFFLVVGLTLKREILHGALRHPRTMLLPVAAALGGMIAPALIYHTLNREGPGVAGFGVPMSTDIAFAIGALTLLGRRVPRNLLVFLLALAIVDDLGAILVIAFYYTSHFRPTALLWAALATGALIVLNRRAVREPHAYVVLGLVLWIALWRAGIDPPLAGVVLAAGLPAGGHHQAPGDPPLLATDRLERRLSPYVTFGILPLFAFANAGLAFHYSDITRAKPVMLGVLLGLLLGKFCGVGLVSWLVLRLRWAHLPPAVTFRHVLGAAWLSGIGFTMALFINTLAFAPGPDRASGKLAILIASPLAAVLGIAWLWRPGPRRPPASREGASAA